MKKIVYVLHGLAAGGTEAFVLNVVQKLNREKYNVTFILALDDDGKNRQFHEETVEKMGIKIYRTCDLNNVKKMFFHYRKLIKLLEETGPYDIIHANMDLFNGVNLRAAKKVGIPVRICHSHNTDSQYARMTGKITLQHIYRNVMRKMIWRYSTCRLGCSELAMNYLYGEDWIKDINSHVLYNGIDLKKFQIEDFDKEYFCRKNNIPLKNIKYSFMTVGRFNNQKNPFFIVEIMREFSKLTNSFHFTWVGNGDLEREVKEKVKEYGLEENFSFLERRNDVAEIMQCHKYFLLPSLFEGLPIALIEAQASGLLCFASDNITRESDVGMCKYYSLKDNASVWAKKIKKEIDKEHHIVESKLKKFSADCTVRELEKYYG